MKLAPGTPVRWQNLSGAIRFGIVQGECGLGYSVLVDGGRRHLVSPEIIAFDEGD